MDGEKVIERLERVSYYFKSLLAAGWQGDSDIYREHMVSVNMALALLKEQEAREPHYTTLEYLVNGTKVIVHHPECPRCIENGLALWDAEIEKGQAYCKRCGQGVKWND